MKGKILIPLDGNEYAEQVVPMATEIAAMGGMAIRLLTVEYPEGFNSTETAGMSGHSRPASSRTGMNMDIYGAGRNAPIWSLSMDTPKEPTEGQVATADSISTRMRKYLFNVGENMESRGVEVETSVGFGNPADEIVVEAERSGATMIALTGSSRFSWEHGSLGKTADRVVNSSPMPVLVFKPTIDAPTAAPDTVIVGLDGSPGAEAGLKQAAEFAKSARAQLALLYVMKRDNDSRRMRATEYLSRLAEPYQPDVVTTVSHGHPETTIMQYADEFQNPVIAVSPHPRTSITKWLHGSTTDKVIRNSSHTVLVLTAGR